MFFTLLAHEVGPQTGLVWAFEASFVFTRLRLLRDIHAAVKASDSATWIGAMLTRSEFGSSRRIRTMSTIRVNEL
jgi:hypothetical protein